MSARKPKGSKSDGYEYQPYQKLIKLQKKRNNNRKKNKRKSATRNGMSESPNAKGTDRNNITETNNNEKDSSDDNNDTVKTDKGLSDSKRNVNERALAKRIGKQAAKQFIECNIMFPNSDNFNLSTDSKSFYMILKSKLNKKNYILKENSFTSFFVRYTNIWFTSCNDARTEIVKKCKEKYFGKYTKGQHLFQISHPDKLDEKSIITR